MARMRGFTLIELMIVVAIIAILAAIAYPAYSRYAYRARRADGQNLLMHLSTAEERYYSTYNAYTDDLTKLGYVSSNKVPSEKGYYSASVATASSSQIYTATATPQDAQADDACGALSIDNTGAKRPGKSDTAANSNGSCW